MWRGGSEGAPGWREGEEVWDGGKIGEEWLDLGAKEERERKRERERHVREGMRNGWRECKGHVRREKEGWKEY